MDLGWPMILLILVVVMVVFGAGKLPKTMKDLGRGVREFRKAQQGGYDEEERPAALTGASATGAGNTNLPAVESHREKPSNDSQQSTEQELAMAKARLEAAEMRLRQLKESGKDM